jgi:hypothetical protein
LKTENFIGTNYKIQLPSGKKLNKDEKMHGK